jgi:hypothetical protein
MVFCKFGYALYDTFKLLFSHFHAATGTMSKLHGQRPTTMTASSEPSKELIVADEFKAQSRGFFSERIEYEAVNCLLISWLNSDINTQELDKLATLFENDLKYTVLKLALPPENPQQFLNLQIASFVQQHSGHRRTLIIIYYAGHGDVDTEGKALWAA